MTFSEGFAYARNYLMTLGNAVVFFRLFLAALLLVPFSSSAGQKAPSGYAKEAFDMWLAAHNSGEPSKLEVFNTTYDKKGDYKWYVNFRESVGKLQLL